MPKNTPQRIIDISRGVAGGGGAVLYTPGGGGAGGGGTGVGDHGALTGLSDDDHPQYHTDTRGDARYVPLARQVVAGAGLSGGGALSSDISLVVNLGEGLEYEGDNVGLAASIAGAGLGYAGGVLAVGVSGLGLGVEADAVTLTSSSDPGQAAAVLATDTNGSVTLRNMFAGQAVQSSAVFASGFAGSGWRADYGITTAGRASVETDDLTVRGRMRVYELLIQQIRATNGSLLVSSSSKVVSVTVVTNPAWTVNGQALTFNGQPAIMGGTYYTINTAAAGDTSRSLYHGFLYGDLIRAQQTQWDGAQFTGVIQSNLEVVGVQSLTQYTAALISGDGAAVGYDYVRLGNTVDSSRRGVVYLTSDDSAAPYIDIVDGVALHSDWNSAGVRRVRLGKLSGISDSAFGGTLSGYGLYGNNVYLKGQMIITGGSLGGLAAADVNSNTTTIDGGRITAGSITAAQIAAGVITADRIVVGTTNMIWLNDASDGTLRIGGNVKSVAPFQVSAYGHLDAIDATFGDLLVDTAGIYINATGGYGLLSAGYKFKYGGAIAAGMTVQYSGTSAALFVDNNASGVDGTTPKHTIDSTSLLRAMAGANKIAIVGLHAKDSTGTTTTWEAINNTTARTVRGYGTVFTWNDQTIWHAGNDGSGSTLDADLLDGQHGSYYAPLSAPTFPTYTRWAAVASAPTIPSGGAVVYLSTGNRFVVAYNDGTNIKYRWLNLTGTDAAWNYQLNGTPPA